jgi:hypothetical protein
MLSRFAPVHHVLRQKGIAPRRRHVVRRLRQGPSRICQRAQFREKTNESRISALRSVPAAFLRTLFVAIYRHGRLPNRLGIPAMCDGRIGCLIWTPLRRAVHRRMRVRRCGSSRCLSHPALNQSFLLGQTREVESAWEVVQISTVFGGRKEAQPGETGANYRRGSLVIFK